MPVKARPEDIYPTPIPVDTLPQPESSPQSTTTDLTTVPEDVIYREKVLIAGVLGLFLGGFGIHNFMIRRTARGAAQLTMTILGGLIIGIFSVIAFFDKLQCNPNVTSPCANWNIPYNLITTLSFYLLIMLPLSWGAIESLIILVTAGKYPLKNDPARRKDPPRPVLY